LATGLISYLNFFNGPYYGHGKNGSYYLRDVTGEILPTKHAAKFLKVIKTPLDTEEMVEVEEIIDHRGIGDDREYLVTWKDLPESENSWVSIDKFNSREIVREYHESVDAHRRHSTDQTAVHSQSDGSGRSKRTRKSRNILDL